MMMADATQYPKKDANGVNCGLIKLGLVIPDAVFEGDIIATEYKNGEWLIYMMNGANWITIKTPQYLPLRHDINPPIESNVTYVMVVEIPPSDSTDYFLEQARRAYARKNMERLIKCIEKVAKEKVPNDLLEAYNNALLAKEQNELIDTIKRRTNYYKTIPDKETFELCHTFITKYPKSEDYQTISKLMRTEGKQYFVQGQGGNRQRSQAISGTTTYGSSDNNTTSNKRVIKSSSRKSTQGQVDDKQRPQKVPISSLTQKKKHDEPFVSVGIGVEPFLFIPEDGVFDTEEFGIEANAVLRIGRPKNLINGMLGIGASTGSEIEPNLHAVSELRFNFGGNDDDNYFVGLGADIALSSFSSTSDNNETDESSCFKVMAGYRKKKFETFLGVRMWDSSALCIGLRWYLF